ncbi:hypothetical protein Tco_0201299 [Tanacetum coccineum]
MEEENLISSSTTNIPEEISEIGLDDKLGESGVEEGVGKWNLYGHGKKALDTKNVVESASSKTILTTSNKVTQGTGLDEQKLAEVVPLKNVETSVTEENLDDGNENNTQPDSRKWDLKKMILREQHATAARVS